MTNNETKILTAREEVERWFKLAGMVLLQDETGADALNELKHHAQVIEYATKYAVEMMREDGATWQAVGDALGVSKQAAQQRFGA